MSQDCIFCKIVHKKAPATLLYEDDEVMAFLDIRPVSEGHSLVIPKAHYETIFDIPEELLGKVHKIAKKIAQAVEKGIQAEGISIIQQNGRAANQDIFHLHVHVIPRAPNKKLLHHNLTRSSNDKLNEVSVKIKAYLK